MNAKKNKLIIFVCLSLYFLNQLIKNSISIPFLLVIVKYYWNDVICGCLIIAITNFILNHYLGREYKIEKLMGILLFDFACGLFWEFIIPIIREDSSSDSVDILAYLLGGIVYWLCVKNERIIKVP